MVAQWPKPKTMKPVGQERKVDCKQNLDLAVRRPVLHRSLTSALSNTSGSDPGLEHDAPVH